MIYILGIVVILLGLWGLYFVQRHANDMPFALFGVVKENCRIIDKKRFNALMVLQGRVIAGYIIVIGLWTVVTGSPITFYLMAVMPLLNVLFTKAGMNYIKVDK